jgi:hypothetical protein
MDHLFNRLDGAYQNRWRAAFSGENAIANWRETWAESFDDERIKPADIATAIKAVTRKYDWPPSLAEFLKLCRPAPEYELLHRDAVKAMRTGEWDSPLLYWATQKTGGFEMRSEPYKRTEKIWKSAIDDLMASGILPDIPPQREPLPAPGQQSISREDAAKRIAELGAVVGITSSKAWAKRIIDNPKNYPAISLEFASEALKSA